MTTLSDGVATLTITDDLAWTDEFAWQPVEQTAERTITGALVVQTALRVAGRPITLAPPDDSSAWLTRALVDQLRAWAAVPAKEMVLVYRGVSRDVIWRHEDGAIDARPIVDFADVESTDYYSATLRFMEI